MQLCSLASSSLQLRPPIKVPTANLVSSAPSFVAQRPLNLTVRALLSSDLEQELRPNALCRKTDPLWRGGFSVGVDLGLSSTGVAISKGFSIRPLTVLKLRGEKLELRLLEIAGKQEADEFVIGVPKSSDGKETIQSNKIRSVAGRLAVRAAERGWRVYLQDEHGTSTEATSLMIDMGVSKSNRQKSSDAYAAMVLLERYFSTSGQETEIVIPKNTDLLEKMRKGAPKDVDFYLDD